MINKILYEFDKNIEDIEILRKEPKEQVKNDK